MSVRVVLVLVCLLLFSFVVDAQSARDIEVEIMDALNAWRVQEGLWPLRSNITLTALAAAQANYLMTLPELPQGGDLHLGRNGETPDIRAQADPYNWPAYGTEDRAEIGEVAAIGGSSGFAVNYWQNSDIHSRTIRNPIYREAGVAAIERPNGFLIIVVLGARANVLPVMLYDDLLYLSNERSPYATADGWIKDATRVRLFDGAGRPLTPDWQPWTLTLPVPDNAGERVFVLYSDGTSEVVSDVVVAAAPVFAAAAPTPTLGPTATPAPPTPTSAPTATPAPQPDLRLVYPGTSLTIINTSGAPLDLTGFSLEGGISLPFSQWQRVADFPLDALPDGHCLQVRPTTQTGDVEMPEGCRWVRSLLNVEAGRAFWRSTDFTVQANGQTLATCRLADGRCTVDVGP